MQPWQPLEKVAAEVTRLTHTHCFCGIRLLTSAATTRLEVLQRAASEPRPSSSGIAFPHQRHSPLLKIKRRRQKTNFPLTHFADWRFAVTTPDEVKLKN